MGWKELHAWLKGGIIAFVLSLPWVYFNFIKALSNKIPGESFTSIIFGLIIIAIFKIMPLILCGILIGYSIDKERYTIPLGFAGLMATLFFVEEITIFVFRTILGYTLLDSPIYDLFTLLLGFIIGALIGLIIEKLESNKARKKK